MENTKDARRMYSALKRKLGRRKALRVTGLTRRSISERDVFRCKLPGRVRDGIVLMYEKYIEGRDRIKEAQEKYLAKEEREALPDLDPDRVCKS